MQWKNWTFHSHKASMLVESNNARWNSNDVMSQSSMAFDDGDGA